MFPFRPRVPGAAVAAALIVAGATSAAPATELIFEPTTVAGTPVDPAYGDRVAASEQDGFRYGAGGAFTPNVTVDYGPWALDLIRCWTTGYGDLEDVLYDEQDGRGYLEVSFAADPGWRVAVEGFDMAAWRIGGAIRWVRVWDGTGQVLFEQADVDVPTTGHVHFGFDPPLEGRWLTIAFDAGNLGTYSDNIGIDNIRFAQVAGPTAVEPESWARTKASFRWRPCARPPRARRVGRSASRRTRCFAPGRDLAERLRTCIRMLHERNGLRFVLLGGDADVVPTRVLVRSTSPELDSPVAGDLYFACLGGTWDEDGDGQFGEWVGDQLDLTAEVAVGPSAPADTR